MRCPRCHSRKIIKIGHLVYCRNCISFGQIRPQQNSPILTFKPNLSNVYYDLNYDLSVKQKEIATQIILALEKQQNILIQAVCGSGKTELVYPCICHQLNQQKRVGFACPRRDLAIELYDRLSNQLKNVDIGLVYGGHHDDLYHSLVVLTCHQLHRYWNYFDVLIIDEVDAFPFAGNQQLYQIARAASRGSFILLSATAFEGAPPPGFVKLTLDRRYHGFDLPVPKLIWLPDYVSLWYMLILIRGWLKKKMLVMVFVPEKKDLYLVSGFLSRFHLDNKIISSDTPFNTTTLLEFRNHVFEILITTTLLERGVTFENVQVIVYRAHHVIFDVSTLIQIAGRVGRKPNFPVGAVYFIGKYVSKEMKLCQKRLLKKNAPYASV